MKTLFQKKLNQIASILEIIVALVITIMIAISIINMITQIIQDPMGIKDSEHFYQFMNDALSLIVGIEFLKMIIIPSANNIIETLLFAVSRQVILDHGLNVMIIGVISITILFIIKKFLLIDKNEKFTIKAQTPLKELTKVFGINLKEANKEKTIGEFFLNYIEENNQNLEEGTSIQIDDFQLELEQIENQKPEKIKIIKENK